MSERSHFGQSVSAASSSEAVHAPPADFGSERAAADDPAYERAPSLRETVAIGAVTMVLTALVISLLGGYWDRVTSFGDSSAYREIAERIVRWEFTGFAVKYTWGYPYLGAGLALLTPLGVVQALVVVSWAGSLIALALAQRLWGGWVAGYFAVTSIEWIHHSVLGASDPPAAALTFGAFLAARRKRWALAAAIASLAAMVRPQAVFALVAVGLVLLGRKDFGQLLRCIAVGLAMVALYMIPVWIALGDPLANYRMYQSIDFPESLLAFPFRAMVSAVQLPYPWSHKIMATFWILVVFAGLVVMARSARSRSHAQRYPVEAVYLALTAAFYFTYNSPFGFQAFARYTLSILPLVYFALIPWLPRRRVVLWTGALAMPVLAGASAMNLRRTIAILRNALTR
jgi:hypothetical protein